MIVRCATAIGKIVAKAARRGATAVQIARLPGSRGLDLRCANDAEQDGAVLKDVDLGADQRGVRVPEVAVGVDRSALARIAVQGVGAARTTDLRSHGGIHVTRALVAPVRDPTEAGATANGLPAGTGLTL